MSGSRSKRRNEGGMALRLDRIVNIDELDMPGHTKIRAALEKWQQDHPINELKIGETDDFYLILKRKEKKK